MEILVWIFWIAIGVIFYTYIGYGIILYGFVFLKERFGAKQECELKEGDLPELTLLIAAYNESSIIDAKMENCQSLRYPSGKLSILWVTDGSNDATNELLKQYPDIQICFSPERKGKTAALNHGMQKVCTELTAFTDANTMLNENALIEIAACFRQKNVGCVAGEKRILTSDKDGASTGGEGLYWKYESKLKELDSRLYSAVGAAGELFAIRTALYEPMPEDTLLDDFVLSLHIAEKGYRIAYCKEAYACEKGSADLMNEHKRKVRIAAGGIQSICRLKVLLNPLRYGILSFQYVSHRVLRWTITPVLFFAIYPLNLILMFVQGGWFYILLFVLQTLFYIMAAVGACFQNKQFRFKILFVPLYFIFMNLNVLQAVPYLMRNKGKGSWDKARRKE